MQVWAGASIHFSGILLLRTHLDSDSILTATVGIASPVLGVITSFQEQIEWTLRVASLIVGLMVGAMSTRRLRKSLSLGRIATDNDLEPDDSDQGIESHMPFVNRLVVWWKRMQSTQFLADATDEQREAIKRDLQPVIEIYHQL